MAGEGAGEEAGVDEVMSLELSTQMLADFVSGRLGGDEHVQLASRIGRYAMSCHVMQYHVMSCDVMSCRVM